MFDSNASVHHKGLNNNATGATHMTMTYENTKFAIWHKRADKVFKSAGFRAPSPDEAKGSFEIGDSPKTFFGYVSGSMSADDWLDQAS